VFLASRGVTGPRYVIEGTHGLAQVVGAPIQIDWDNEKLDCFDRLALKSYNTAVPGQSSIFCILELRKAHAIDPAEVDGVEDVVFQEAYDFMGGGSFGPKTDVHTKEDADHSLPYLLAVALLDGDVQPAQLEPSRIDVPDVQDLLKKVTVRPDDAFTARYPGEVPSRITVRLKNGKSYSHEVNSYPGFPTRPFTWNEVVPKFDRLVAGRADDGLAREIKAAVRSLETIQVKDLMKPLGHVKADQPG
jgi:2-methylcitrate dehydratase